MRKNFIIPLIISIALGFVSAQIVYSTYRSNLEKTSYNAYLILVDSYSKEEKDSIDYNNSDYLIVEENNVINVYAGITTDLVNANKIKNIYSERSVETYIKPTIINNVEFLSNLEQYDLLISEVEDEKNIISINDVILSSYEEMVLGK